MRIYMQMRDTEDQPPKYCQLQLEPDLLGGWMLVREVGNVGSAGRVKREYFGEPVEAERAMIELRDAQLKRGFQVVFVQGQVAHR